MNLHCLVMNFNENIKNEWGSTYKITHSFATYCPSVAPFASYKTHLLSRLRRL